MSLKKVLNRHSVRVGLPGSDKNEIIRNLLDIIVRNAGTADKEVLLAAVMEREAQMSTGMKNGIAIPHGKTDAVTELHAALAVSREPVDFDSLDKQPARIFVMTVSPLSHSGPHLQFLAEISSLLSSEEIRQNVLNAKTGEELLEAFTGKNHRA